MLPVVADVPQHYELARLGHSGSLVVDARRPLTAPLGYVVRPGSAIGKRRWLEVVMDVRAELGSRRSRGFAYINAETDGLVSASIELRPAGGTGVRWTAVTLHGGQQGVSRHRTLRVRMTNYAREQATTPGRHTLRFRMRRFDGFRVRRVEITPRSGLLVTRQPPQALTGKATVRPEEPEAGRTFTVRVRLVNTGVIPARKVGVETLASAGLKVAEPVPRVADIPAGESREVELTGTAVDTGPQLLQVLSRSTVGQDLRVLRLSVVTPNAASGDTDGTRLSWLVVAGAVGLAAVGAVGAAQRNRLRRA